VTLSGGAGFDGARLWEQRCSCWPAWRCFSSLDVSSLELEIAMHEVSPEDRVNPAEHRIRQRAYELWEQSGQSEGSEMDFWLLAEREIAGQDAEGKAPPNSDTSSR
jgi:Protein of unknown function (DUF2934)